MLFEYINLILNTVGLPSVLTVGEIVNKLMSFTEWWQIMDPQLIFSIICIFSFMYTFFFISCILPFRLFKIIFKLDKKRGK